jgi:hypothetical protein
MPLHAPARVVFNCTSHLASPKIIASALSSESGEYYSHITLSVCSVWRPITGPHQDSPLALCDWRTVQQGDLVPADMVFPHYCDEGYELLHSSCHRWFYKRAMSTDEVILLKLDDTDDHEAKCEPLIPDFCFNVLRVKSLSSFSIS